MNKKVNTERKGINTGPARKYGQEKKKEKKDW